MPLPVLSSGSWARTLERSAVGSSSGPQPAWEGTRIWGTSLVVAFLQRSTTLVMLRSSLAAPSCPGRCFPRAPSTAEPGSRACSQMAGGRRCPVGTVACLLKFSCTACRAQHGREAPVRNGWQTGTLMLFSERSRLLVPSAAEPSWVLGGAPQLSTGTLPVTHQNTPSLSRRLPPHPG